MECPAGFGTESYSTSFVIMMQKCNSLVVWVFFFNMMKALICLSKAPLTANPPPRKFILWRIPIWLRTDLWPRFNELFQIDHRMTWERDSGEDCVEVRFLKQAFMLYLCVQRHTRTPHGGKSPSSWCTAYDLTFDLRTYLLMRERALWLKWNKTPACERTELAANATSLGI